MVTDLEAGNFLASIDLLEAYLHVPIHPRHRKYGFPMGHTIFNIGCSLLAWQIHHRCSPRSWWSFCTPTWMTF